MTGKEQVARLPMTALLLAMLAFLASHAIPARPRFRDAGIRLLGNTGYHLAYSLLSLGVTVWLGVAYAHAPFVPVWDQQPWMRWVPVVAMFFACQLIVAGVTTPNPFSIGIGGRRFDPDRPGILCLTRHPLFWALGLWAGAHIVPNGDVAALILFVPLLLLALPGPRLLERKRRRALGADAFAALARHTHAPAWAMLREIGLLRVGGGVLLYVALLHLHPIVIGVSPLPQ
jgi:uncharacterized membrane protein